MSVYIYMLLTRCREVQVVKFTLVSDYVDRIWKVGKMAMFLYIAQGHTFNKNYVPNCKVHRAAGGRSQYFGIELFTIVLLMDTLLSRWIRISHPRMLEMIRTIFPMSFSSLAFEHFLDYLRLINLRAKFKWKSFLWSPLIVHRIW